jgi:hypothetical protein
MEDAESAPFDRNVPVDSTYHVFELQELGTFDPLPFDLSPNGTMSEQEIADSLDEDHPIVPFGIGLKAAVIDAVVLGFHGISVPWMKVGKSGFSIRSKNDLIAVYLASVRNVVWSDFRCSDQVFRRDLETCYLRKAKDLLNKLFIPGSDTLRWHFTNQFVKLLQTHDTPEKITETFCYDRRGIARNKKRRRTDVDA